MDPANRRVFSFSGVGYPVESTSHAGVRPSNSFQHVHPFGIETRDLIARERPVARAGARYDQLDRGCTIIECSTHYGISVGACDVHEE